MDGGYRGRGPNVSPVQEFHHCRSSKTTTTIFRDRLPTPNVPGCEIRDALASEILSSSWKGKMKDWNRMHLPCSQLLENPELHAIVGMSLTNKSAKGCLKALKCTVVCDVLACPPTSCPPNNITVRYCNFLRSLLLELGRPG